MDIESTMGKNKNRIVLEIYIEKLGLKICNRKLEEKQSQWPAHIKRKNKYTEKEHETTI
jgi:hypothetical protein